MANVIQAPIEFQPRPVGHSPSPLSFGFGLTSHSVGAWPSTSHMNPTAFSPHFSNIQQSSPSKAQKRRHDSEENDERMDRSPTPERPKRIIKRLKPTVAQEPASHEKESKENKAPAQGDDNDVDVGLLLGEYTESLAVTS